MALQTKPEWLDKKIVFKDLINVHDILKGLDVHTVCHQARCPNISECFSKKTATFLILGDTCTRGCAFCNVKTGKPGQLNACEPAMVAEAASRLGLKYAVITSVTRDDLVDGGARAFADCVTAIKEKNPGIKTEVLVPDFKGDKNAVDKVLEAGPGVFGHNVETVPSLYNIRKGADYRRSLDVLAYVSKKGYKTKSSIMLGMGEKITEVYDVMSDLLDAGVSYLSLGQYLQPAKNNHPVKEYIEPKVFDELGKKAKWLGFESVMSGVYVRSSYSADSY